MHVGLTLPHLFVPLLKTNLHFRFPDHSGQCRFRCFRDGQDFLGDSSNPTSVHTREFQNTRNNKWYDCHGIYLQALASLILSYIMLPGVRWQFFLMMKAAYTRECFFSDFQMTFLKKGYYEE